MSVEIVNLPGDEAAALVSPGLLWPALQARLEARLVTVMADAVGQLPFAPADPAATVAALVREFYGLYPSRPVTDNKGGSGFNDSLWLFVLARLIAPKHILESGVHKGHGTWVLRRACPEADIVSCDITLKNLIYHDENARYFECDWTDPRVELSTWDRSRSLIFFDDHISHAQRVREAKVRGFRLSLFDDNLPVETIYATGGPPLPTLAMIMDESLAPGCEIAWTRNAKSYKYRYKAEDIQGVSDVIDHYFMLPDLAPINRYSAGSGLSFVQLAE